MSLSPTRRPWRSRRRPAATVAEVSVKEGDSVSEGTLILTLEGAAEETVPAKGSVSGDATTAPSEPAGYGSAAGAHETITISVPDIGDYTDVPVISVFVTAGDDIEPESALIELESDKATMEVPAPTGGKVVDILIKEGDAVSEGTPILTLSTGIAAIEPQAPAPVDAPASRPTAPATGDIHAEMLVAGIWPRGAIRPPFGRRTLACRPFLVERWSSLGGVCLNVGCIPSKALLHAAKVIAEADEMGEHGISYAKPKIDIDKLRSWKEGVVQSPDGRARRPCQAAQGPGGGRHGQLS